MEDHALNVECLHNLDKHRLTGAPLQFVPVLAIMSKLSDTAAL